MKLKKWFANWNLTNLKINVQFLEAEISFSNQDRKAAWELYVELITRTATQKIMPKEGDEKTALESIYSIFGITREILKKYGSDTIEFSKIAIIVLNQVVRPFTAKWHKISTTDEFHNSTTRKKFREELAELQISLRNYSRLLSEIAQVEDLTQVDE